MVGGRGGIKPARVHNRALIAMSSAIGASSAGWSNALAAPGR